MRASLCASMPVSATVYVLCFVCVCMCIYCLEESKKVFISLCVCASISLCVFVTLQLCRPVAVCLIPFLWETEMLGITVLCELLYCPGLCFSGASIKVNWLLGEEWWPSAMLQTHTLFPETDRMVPRYTTPLDSTQPDGK